MERAVAVGLLQILFWGRNCQRRRSPQLSYAPPAVAALPSRYRRRIRCQKIFAVPGNHDKKARKLKEEFSWLDNLAEVSIHGHPIVLCHYALRVWNRSNRGSWHLYGHSHGRLPEMPTSLSMDVGIDTHEFRPWHYDEIAGVMEKKSEAQKEGRT
jgi:calcineurin-like phosphoesterase family protein